MGTSVTGGQTFPAKFVFDVTAAPNCSSDYVVIGVPATPASGGQANIIGVNNLYSGSESGALCGTAPAIKFAYASGAGPVPASIAISADGTQIAYIENVSPAVFHVLTIGTTGNNGTGTVSGNNITAVTAALPGTGNNAVDRTVPLNAAAENSTTTVYVDYYDNVAYADTYGTNTGYIYKISNVFGPSSSPTPVWHYQMTPAAYPSTLVYDYGTKRIYFTDSTNHIDYLPDNGTSAGTIVQSAAPCVFGATVTGPVIVDSTNRLVYAYFKTGVGTTAADAVIVQAPFALTSCVAAPVGEKNGNGNEPEAPDFNNAWYTGTGTPLIYAAGPGTNGTTPTLYTIGFASSTPGAAMNATSTLIGALATGTADASPVTEFYNTTLGKDFIFVGVTAACEATGVTGGCIRSIDITNGPPTSVNPGTGLNAILAAGGGTSGISVDNNSSATEAASVYYGTKTGATLVKVTQSGLN